MFQILILAFAVLCLALIFFLVCILCDGYVVPAVEVFIEQYKIPEEVAAVTLIAFGSACPELLLNIVSAQEDESELSQPAILGSGMIAFGLIPSLCLIFSPYDVLKLKVKPIIRENSFFVISLLSFLLFSQDGKTDTFEMLFMIGIYFVYVFCVLGQMRNISNDKDEEEEEGEREMGGNGRDLENGDGGGGDNGDRGLDRDRNRDSIPLLGIGDGDGNGAARERGGDVRIREWDKDRDRKGGGSGSGSGEGDDEAAKEPFLPSIWASFSRKVPWAKPTVRWLKDTFFGDNVKMPSCTLPPLLRGGVSRVSAAYNSAKARLETFSDGCHYVLDRIVPALTPTSTTISTTSASTSLKGASSPSSSSPSSPTDTKGNVEAGVAQVTACRALMVLFVCISYVTILVSLLINTCQLIIDNSLIESTTIGGTLLAFGSQIPDISTSIALARNGYGDAAVAGAIGSQVIGLTLGVGLPALALLMTGGSAKISVDEVSSVGLLTMLVLLIVGVYSIATIPFLDIGYSGKIPKFTLFTKAWANCMLLIFIVSYGYFVFKNES